MSVIGIIAEFNPLHNGHKYLINEAKKYGTVVCAISGNFVQRGDTAIFEKSVRTKAALSCGADLVLELPVCYSMSTAANFALGAVSILDAIGCDYIMFGSECGEVEKLYKTCEILESENFSQTIKTYLQNGMTFAKARQKSAEDCGAPKDVLDGANNTLGIEYILASKKINSNIKFKTVTRLGAPHDSLDFESEFVSASAIREHIKQDDFDSCKTHFPKETLELFLNSDYSDIKNLESTILGLLRTKTKKDFECLPDLSEGIENKLFSAIKTAKSLEGLYENIKVKRYTLARIRRLVLSAFLGIDNSMFLRIPPYLRVLGFNKTGENLLRENKENSKIPVIMRSGEIENLCLDAKKVFDTECRATDLYALSLKTPIDCGLEFTRPLIKQTEKTNEKI